METKSGSYPPNMVSQVHSFSHLWLRKHPEVLDSKFLDIRYKEIDTQDIPEVKNLQLELFPIQYSDSLYESVNKTIYSIGAYLYHEWYEEGLEPLLVGLILFRIIRNESNEFLRYSYFLQETHSAYVITIGVLEELRGRGIAKSLINKSLEICRNAEPRPLYISLHVAEYNNEAIPFYEKLGFELKQKIDSHYMIEGEFYGAFLYIYYFQEAKKPILTWKNLTSTTKNFFKFPTCFKLF